MHVVLRRPIYRGLIVWNATRKRNAWGQRQTQVRPEGEHLTIDAEHQRIVDADLWAAPANAARLR
ncbi:Recombinase [Luteitalea pratensis]|uniref:Recombinase n=1 Tax=Luteitalea pratensis TaxID=1855912 RepID=A0A143PQ48_LUTPR|nr:Recombinase [Luteitalea pratensis]